jgi:hypothetical protein
MDRRRGQPPKSGSLLPTIGVWLADNDLASAETGGTAAVAYRPIGPAPITRTTSLNTQPSRCAGADAASQRLDEEPAV